MSVSEKFENYKGQSIAVLAAVVGVLGAGAVLHYASPKVEDSYVEEYGTCLSGTRFDPNQAHFAKYDVSGVAVFSALADSGDPQILSFTYTDESLFNPWAEPVALTSASAITAAFLAERGCPLPIAM